jgi:hypothetical protein
MPLVVGRWYFVVPCGNKRCKHAVIVAEAPEPLTPDELASDSDYVEAECRNCGTRGRWYMREWQRVLPKPARNANDN